MQRKPVYDLDFGRSKAFLLADGSVTFQGGARDGEIWSKRKINKLFDEAWYTPQDDHAR